MDEKLAFVQSRGRAVHGFKYKYEELRRLPNGVLQVLLQCDNSEHAPFWQATNNHYAGKGCTACNRPGVTAQHELKTVKEKFQVKYPERYEYLELDRSGKYPILKLQCEVHGIFTQNMYNHLAGKGCRECKQGKSNKISDFTIEESAEAVGSISTGSYSKYKSRIRIVKLLCAEHGEYEQQLSPLLRGATCPSCAAIAGGISRRNTLEELQSHVIQSTSSTAKIVDQDYENRSVLIECSKHGLSVGNRNSVFAGVGCKSCSAGASKESDEVYLKILELGLEVEREHTIPNTRQRLDFYIPKAKLGIEYHGIYWHSESKVGRSYHKDKHAAAELAGIEVIHIFSDEWKLRNDAVMSLIKSRLNLNTESVYARKLTITKLNTAEAGNFLEVNHIQGSTASSRYVGLSTTDGTLVACLAYSIRDSNRTKSDGSTCEITRFASSTRVVGGFTKLLSWVKNTHKEVKRFITFSDIRCFTGKMYASTGFEVVGKLPPDYSYVVNNIRVHKSRFKKCSFKNSKTLKYVEGLTETELAKLNNLARVWDCGKIKWELVL